MSADDQRGGGLVNIRIGDPVTGGELRTRAMVIQQKTNRPVQFEIMSDARGSLLAWLERRGGSIEDFAFTSRVDHPAHMSMRQADSLRPAIFSSGAR